MPYGGIKMAEESCRNYGYEPSERLHEIFRFVDNYREISFFYNEDNQVLKDYNPFDI